MKNRNALIISIISFLGICAIYGSLPEQIPLHWNAAGEIDNYGAKWNIFWLAAMPVAMTLFFEILPKIDPRRDSYEKHGKALGWINWFTVILFIVISWITVGVSKGMIFDVSKIVLISIGILFLGMGNFMGQLRQNYFVGIKTPWTLANETVWRKTHRKGAAVFALMGLCMIVSILLPAEYITAVIISVTLAGTAYLIIYSYLEYRKIA
ncbi:MAG TPA: SdpI family protein [bacterium]|nr:SdpI family protein [bacterium]HPS29586.1 SdpI family protein [bacterium]